jgi:hypothetical protein
MALSSVQQGVISQNEYAKLGMMGSDGKLEVSWPMSDDERRDAEVHQRGQFGQTSAWQIKSSMVLHTRPRLVEELLYIHFTVSQERLLNDPRFWYFFAYLDRQTMAFRDPVFIVDSLTVHKLAIPRLRGDTWYFGFQAGMGAHSHDKWTPYRVRTIDVGKRVLEILRDLDKLPTAERALPDLSQLPGLVLVRRRVS